MELVNEYQTLLEDVQPELMSFCIVIKHQKTLPVILTKSALPCKYKKEVADKKNGGQKNYMDTSEDENGKIELYFNRSRLMVRILSENSAENL